MKTAEISIPQNVISSVINVLFLNKSQFVMGHSRTNILSCHGFLFFHLILHIQPSEKGAGSAFNHLISGEHFVNKNRLHCPN